MSGSWDDDLEHLSRQVGEIRARIDQAAAAKAKLTLPGMAEFVLGADYLAQPKIYPRQLTLLRVIFCEVESLTDYDHSRIADWGTGFEKRPMEERSKAWLYEPARDTDFVSGSTPDVLERMIHNRAEGRPWMRETNLVLGRRGGKGHIGAISCGRIVAEVLALGDPQAHFGIPRNKRIVIPVFAGNREQARFNLFADIAGLIIESPIFAPYVQALYRDKLVIATPADLARPDRPFEGSIEIQAKESTGTSGRGLATIAQFYDEMAFVEPGTSKASAEELYTQATPALDQFGEWAALFELSSPHHQTGEFFEIHCRARELEPRTGKAVFPEIFTLQEPSWGMYEDAEKATTIEMVTEAEAAANPAMADEEGRPLCFPSPGRPIMTNDHQMAQHQRANKLRFRTERLAQWGTSIGAYFDPDDVEAIFSGYLGTMLKPNDQPSLGTSYVVVVDPATKHDAFAWVIAHREPVDDVGRPHVLIDLMRRWLPDDHGGQLDISEVHDQLESDIRHFRAAEVVTDQYGGPFVVQDLNRRLYYNGLAGHSAVRENPRSRDKNLTTAAVFAEAIALGQVHCYPDDQLRRELLFIQETPGGRIVAPTSGPVQTDDVAIAVMVVTELLLGHAADQPIHDALSATRLSGRPGLSPTASDQATFDRLSDGGGQPRPGVGERSRPGGPRRLPRWIDPTW